MAGGIQPVEIVVKTNMKSVDALSGALDRVEKQVGKVNKTTVFFDASGATNQLKDLKKQLEKSEKFVDQFLGRTNAARKVLERLTTAWSALGSSCLWCEKDLKTRITILNAKSVV